jgi:hypothetical protein
MAAASSDMPPFGISGSIRRLGLKLSNTSVGDSPVDYFFAWLLTNYVIRSQHGQSS